MSGQPFNAMWVAPPPPSHTDTFDLNPLDYVVLTTSSGDEAFVHRDCLMESPVLRLAFRKRVPLHTDQVVVEFVTGDELRVLDTPAPPSITVGRSTSDSEQPAASRSDATIGACADGGEEPEAEALADSPADDAGGVHVAVPSPQHPVVLTETLQTDKSVQVLFPRLSGEQLNVVVSYMYFKHRHNRHPGDERPAFTIPVSAALAVMRVAQTLEC